jgi:hypothetical protein
METRGWRAVASARPNRSPRVRSATPKRTKGSLSPAELRDFARQLGALQAQLDRENMEEFRRVIAAETAGENDPWEWLPIDCDCTGCRTAGGFGVYNIDGTLLRTVASAAEAQEIIRKAKH